MGGYESACDHLSVVIAQAAVIDSVRIAGAQPDWQYHIALLLPDEGIQDQALLKIYQVVEHELRTARADAIGECVAACVDVVSLNRECAADSSDEQSKYAYECYAAGAEQSAVTLEQLKEKGTK
jgi:hypothetical protein